MNFRDKKKTIEEVVFSFISYVDEDIQHRYTSWESCFRIFGKSEDIENLALHLGFYLASWGMYRGSSGLLQKNYEIHIGAVEIINSFKFLRCEHDREVDLELASQIYALVKDLEKYYSGISFKRRGQSYNISPTATLISKIIMGTLGGLPALDRYFLEGIKLDGKKVSNSLSLSNITSILSILKEKQKEIDLIQAVILEKREMYYPRMKILDMYYWQLGYDFG